MRFIAEKRGALLYSCHFVILCFLVCAVVAVRFLPVALLLLAAALLLACLIYFRLCHCEVFTKDGVLHLHKGCFFPVHSSVPLRFVTGGKLLASPLARVLGVCVCTIYSSGKTSLLFGISLQNAQSLLGLLNKGSL